MLRSLIPLMVIFTLSCKTREPLDAQSDVEAVSSSAYPNECIKDYINWETRSNDVASRSPESVKIKVLDIPASLVKFDVAAYASKSVKDTLIIEKQGKTYIRWVINPEDSAWYVEVQKYLQKKLGKDAPEPVEALTGYMTASRSYIIVDPRTNAIFSIKTSTNSTGGAWTDKKQEWSDSLDIRAVSDYLNLLSKRMKLKYSTIFMDTLAIGIEEIDQAIVVRELGDLATCKHNYLPGFSVFHDSTRKLTGDKLQADFWRQHYAEALGRSLGEFAAISGLTFDSPHSQNFLIELDATTHRPTGRIAIKDLGDVYVLPEQLRAQPKRMNGEEIIRRLEAAHNVFERRLIGGFGFLHGNKIPAWISPEEYSKWGAAFFSNYEAVYSSLVGNKLATMKATPMSDKYGSYQLKHYELDDEWLGTLVKNSPCLRGRKGTADNKACPIEDQSRRLAE